MLHLISADLPSDALALVGHLQQRLSTQGEPYQLIDLSGDGLLASLHTAPSEVIRFQQGDYQLLVWGRIKPALNDWLNLLQLQDARPELMPPLPGLAQLLQCCALADWLAPAPECGPVPETVVVLPPLQQALELLQLARTGPALLDQWLEPLLGWWQETRRSINRLDLLLRLTLPDGDALRLSPPWRERLNHLAHQLSDPRSHQLLCVLDGGARQVNLLQDRLCRIYLRGFQPARLWIRGSGAGPSLQALAAIRGAMAVGYGPELHNGGCQLDAWLDQPWIAEQLLDWSLEAETASCNLLLPGLRKELLQVQQLDQELMIGVGGFTRQVTLPEALANKQCTGAKIVGRHLQLLLM